MTDLYIILDRRNNVWREYVEIEKRKTLECSCSQTIFRKKTT
jgi:hypothetical protein